MQDKVIVVLCTVPSEGEVAMRLARGMVEGRLAACVNVVPGIRSVYRWKGELCDDPETLLVIKTRQGCFEQLDAWLQKEHPYDVPEVIALPVERGAMSYLQWVTAQTS